LPFPNICVDHLQKGGTRYSVESKTTIRRVSKILDTLWIAQTHDQRFIYYSSSLGVTLGASKSGTETACPAEKWMKSDAAEVVAVS